VFVVSCWRRFFLVLLTIFFLLIRSLCGTDHDGHSVNSTNQCVCTNVERCGGSGLFRIPRDYCL
jgi:hypothetical protein